MEQNRKPGEESSLIWSINPQQRRLVYTMGGVKAVSPMSTVEKAGQTHAKMKKRKRN